MKKIALFTLLAGLAQWGCRRSAGCMTTALESRWELRKVSGMSTVTYPPGNGNILQFTGSRYQIYQNGALVKSGAYLVIKDTTVNTSTCLIFAPGRFANRIIYDSNYNITRTFEETCNNQLTIVSGCFAYDGGSFSFYEKQ